MPEITAQGKIFRDWESLLGACAQNASLLPGIDPLKTNLEALLAQARDLKVQQESFTGNQKAATQSLRKTIADAREAARKLRAQVIVHLGTDSQHLTQFGVTPRQKRPRKAKPSTTPPEVAGTPETPKPPVTQGQ